MLCTVGYMSVLLSVICQCSIFNRFQAGRPRLWYTIAHDYGTATHLLWCPSGCYEPVDEKVTQNKTPLPSLPVQTISMYVFSLFKGTLMYVFKFV